jgi:hypothetical protein
LEINNWFRFATFSLFTLAVILIGLPASIYLIKKGVEGFVKYKFAKLPDRFLIAFGLGNYSIEIIFYGLLLLACSIWYLFFDKGGQLGNFVNQVRSFCGVVRL